MTASSENVHGTDVCETLIHYLPWMLIAAMGITVTVSVFISTITFKKCVSKTQ